MALFDTQCVLTRIIGTSVINSGGIRVSVQMEAIFVATDGVTVSHPQVNALIDPTQPASTFATAMRAAADAWASANGWNTPVNNLFIPAYNKV